MAQAVIYARFSPRAECGGLRFSVEKQTERCRALLQAHGYEVIGEKHDNDMSGGRADNRPGLQAAIALACKHKAVLVVYKLDRLARNTRDALEVLERLQKSKADLASLVEQINSRSPMGRFFFTQLAAFAELEREQIRERTSAAMRSYQADGRRMTRRTAARSASRPTRPTRRG